MMSNHHHLVIETPAATLVAGMQWPQNTYTRRFNVRTLILHDATARGGSPNRYIRLQVTGQ